MPMASWIILAVLGIAFVAIVAMSRRRRSDPAASFQRQIDALSPEARRGVTERVRDLTADDARADEEPDDGT
jgi:hypothetical protein